jgi:hypothetical protein
MFPSDRVSTEKRQIMVGKSLGDSFVYNIVRVMVVNINADVHSERGH